MSIPLSSPGSCIWTDADSTSRRFQIRRHQSSRTREQYAAINSLSSSSLVLLTRQQVTMEETTLSSSVTTNFSAESAPVTPRALTLPPLRHSRQFSLTTVTPVKRRKFTRPVSSQMSSSSIRTALPITPSSKAGLSRPNMTASNSITLDMLRPHFEEPLAKVAASFGICVTLLKKICRRHGIARWPHRQITGLRKSIASMEHAIGYFDGIRRESYAEQLLKQKKKLAALLDDPTINNPLLAHEDEMTNGLTNALPLHQIESGHNVKPAPTNHHALSPRGPLPMESPQYTVPSVAISSQMSSMCPPAAFYIEQSYTPEFHQTCSPHVYMQSRPEAYLSMRYYNRGATNSVSSTSLSPIYQLPPLRRESRPMLPPISSLVAVRNNSIYSS